MLAVRCSQPTYEGLKLVFVWLVSVGFLRSQPTYEGLKRVQRWLTLSKRRAFPAYL